MTPIWHQGFIRDDGRHVHLDVYLRSILVTIIMFLCFIEKSLQFTF